MGRPSVCCLEIGVTLRQLTTITHHYTIDLRRVVSVLPGLKQNYRPVDINTITYSVLQPCHILIW